MKFLVLFFLIFACIATAEEFGVKKQPPLVSTYSILVDPNSYSGKTVAIWGVLGGFSDKCFLFANSDHEKWRDLANAIVLEVVFGDSDMKLWNEKYTFFYGCNAYVEGIIVVDRPSEKSGSRVYLNANFVFIPRDERQTKGKF